MHFTVMLGLKHRITIAAGLFSFWAGLPSDKTMPPRSRCSADSECSLTRAPRFLKEPITRRSPNRRHFCAPAISASMRKNAQGVSMMLAPIAFAALL